MNCRKVNSLLSAYIDRELAQGEREAVEEHLAMCSPCHLEHETLLQTKHAVASLAGRVSRDEIARLLADAETAPPPFWAVPIKVSPVAATALLSLAGLWLATTSLDGPRDWHRTGPEYVMMPSAMTQGSITPMLAPLGNPVTVTTVSSPMNVYAVAPDGEIVGQTTVRQVHVYTSVPRPPSFREIIGRVFGRPAHPTYSAGGMMGGFVGGNVPAGYPTVRVLGGRPNPSYNGETLLQNAVADRYATSIVMH